MLVVGKPDLKLLDDFKFHIGRKPLTINIGYQLFTVLSICLNGRDNGSPFLSGGHIEYCSIESYDNLPTPSIIRSLANWLRRAMPRFSSTFWRILSRNARAMADSKGESKSPMDP